MRANYQSFRWKHVYRLFQSTPSYEGELTLPPLRQKHDAFQSTPSYEGEPKVKACIQADYEVSIHALV